MNCRDTLKCPFGTKALGYGRCFRLPGSWECPVETDARGYVGVLRLPGYVGMSLRDKGSRLWAPCFACQAPFRRPFGTKARGYGRRLELQDYVRCPSGTQTHGFVQVQGKVGNLRRAAVKLASRIIAMGYRLPTIEKVIFAMANPVGIWAVAVFVMDLQAASLRDCHLRFARAMWK